MADERYERRTFAVGELRAQRDDEKGMIGGYAALFNTQSEDLGGFREKIRPGAFALTIVNDDIRALFNHDSNYVIGRNRAKTLRLMEDEKGLAFEAEPPETQWARDLMESIRRGDVSEMSFQFVTETDTWQQDEEGLVTRELVQVRLYDVSPVTYPAYPQTSVSVRQRFQEFLSQEAHNLPGNENERQLQAQLAHRRRLLDLINQ